LLLRGPYGHYVQLGEVIEGEKTKPKRVSWQKEMPLEQADLASALKLLSLPREVGTHPESGKKVIVNIGRFGPYIGHDGKFKSIPRTDSIFDITLDRALELLAQAKTGGNTVLRTLGEHPEYKTPVEICSGRYGPYARHGKINATLPKETSPEAITLEEALELISAKAAKGGTGKIKTVRKSAVKKTTKAKSTAKPKTAVKKATTKTTADKSSVKNTTKEKAVTKKVAAKPAEKKPAAKKTTKKVA
jgi:DNA topoisomerase-1